MTRLTLSVVALILAFGCASTDIIDERETVPEIIEAPPRVEWIIPPRVAIPPEPNLRIYEWTAEMIEAEPVRYQEVLYSDLAFLRSYADAVRSYLLDLELARDRVIAASEVHDDDLPE